MGPTLEQPPVAVNAFARTYCRKNGSSQPGNRTPLRLFKARVHQQEGPMISHGYDSNRSRGWSQPRPPMDPSLRLRTHGRVRPLAEDMTWWERIFQR